jgi:hypothetical protein
MKESRANLKPDAAEHQRRITDANYEFYTAHLETTERGTLMVNLLQKQLAELSEHEKHLWDSSEYSQVTAAAAWIAGARAAIVGDLLNCAYQSDPEAPLGCDLTRPIRDDIAAAIDSHARISEAWVNYRDEVSVDPDFRLGDGYTVGSTYEWPSVDAVSQELFDVLRYIVGVRNLVDTSTLIDRKLPATLPANDHMHPFFKKFNKSLDARYDQLLKHRQLLRVRNRDDMSVRSESGRALYGDMVRLVEDAIALGVARLYPASFDPTLRLNEKHGKKPETNEIILPLLDPRTMTANPLLPEFSPAALSPLALPEHSPAPEPILPQFSLGSLGVSNVEQPVTRTVTTEPVDQFDPAVYFDKPTDGSRPDTLPPFDPSTYFGK